MALKIISGAWFAANDENRQQRDSKRKEFFEQSGIVPAKRMRDVFVPGSVRLERTLGLFEAATAERVGGDQQLAAIVDQMKSEIGFIGLAASNIMPEVERQAIGMLGYSPEAFKKFFNVDLETALGHAFKD